MKNFLILILLCLNILVAHASDKERWIKLTCFGPVTPQKQKAGSSLKFADLADAYFLNTGGTIMSVEELHQKNIKRFDALNDYCHQLRMQKMELSSLASGQKWLDWGTDYQYTGLKVSLVEFKPGLCRALNEPCQKNTDCCSKSMSCSTITHSCISNIASPNKNLPTK